MALMCLAGVLCVSCTKNEDGPEPKPVQPQDDPIKETPIKELSFITQEKTLEDYDKWVYVNLETGETVMKKMLVNKSGEHILKTVNRKTDSDHTT